LYDIIVEERENDVSCRIYINSSSSTRVVTIASYVTAASMGVDIYYTRIKDYQSEKSDAEKIIEIPVMPIKPQNKTHLDVINKINEENEFDSLKDLVVKGLNLDYGKGTNRNKYSRIVRELEDLGFVKTSKFSRAKKKIKLTESGKIMANISYLFHDN